MTTPVQHLNGKVKPDNARFVVRLEPDLGYAVWSPEGERVTEYYIHKPYALERMTRLQEAADKAAQRRVRPCMTCRHDFVSEGIHNRMCPRCRAHGRETDSPASIGRISGIRRSA